MLPSLAFRTAFYSAVLTHTLSAQTVPMAEKAKFLQRNLIDKHLLDGLYVSMVPAAPEGTKNQFQQYPALADSKNAGRPFPQGNGHGQWFKIDGCHGCLLLSHRLLSPHPVPDRIRVSEFLYS